MIMRLDTGVYMTPESCLRGLPAALRDGPFDVDHVVLRCGFDPTRPADGLDAAADAVRAAGLGLVLLIGGWWGEGIRPAAGDEVLTPFLHDLPDVLPETAHESRWPMHCPTGRWTDVVASAAARLAARHAPDGLMLTHARFPHAADLPRLFASGGVIFCKEQIAVGLEPAAISDAVDGAFNPDLPYFGLTRHPLLNRWWSYRSQVMTSAVRRVGSAVTACSPGTAFGVSTLSRPASLLAGQDTERLDEFLQIIHVLTGWFDWHVRQPVEAWSAWLRRCFPDMSPPLATSKAAAALGFASWTAAAPLQLLDDHLLPENLAKPFGTHVVLRGDDPPKALRRLVDYSRSLNYKIAFQGHDSVVA